MTAPELVGLAVAVLLALLAAIDVALGLRR